MIQIKSVDLKYQIYSESYNFSFNGETFLRELIFMHFMQKKKCKT
jgi:hypothetical protein